MLALNKVQMFIPYVYMRHLYKHIFIPYVYIRHLYKHIFIHVST